MSGRIESGESQEEAVVREVSEEIGLRVRPVAKIWECHTDDHEFLLHWWIVDVVEGELKLEPDEASAARCVSTEDLVQLEPTFAGDREFFGRVLPGLS